MKFKSFTLDPFQEEAVTSLLAGNSVVVSAATGTGKTLIADFMIDHALQQKQKVFYTAPIKALSNQKYHDFCAEYGKDNVGLLTGDTVINPEAQVVVMTTEIYRNMLHEGSSTLNGLQYIVFDEIHYINDIERGTVWEESVIFSPEHVRFICLSATIPNFRQFADWIASVTGHTVDTVSYMQRAVPLDHFIYDGQKGMTNIKDITQDDTIPQFRTRRRKKHNRVSFPVANHLDVVRELKSKDWVPAIFFVFSRKLTLQFAQELSRKHDFVKPEDKDYILSYVRQHITEDIVDMPSVQALREILPKGIGVHNAGLLPQLKHIVEHLFNKGYLKVLYATETFAVGINMPAKAVCFASMLKYDGINFRILNSKEYFQLAGRAGRRGIDTVGRSIVIVDKNRDDIFKMSKTMQKDVDPIVSQFTLSYNTVLNLIKNYTDEDITTILKSNFGYFVKKQSEQQYRITTSFNNYKRLLTKLGYVQDNQLTVKGEFATHIYMNELVVGELVFDKLLDSLSLSDMNVLLASMLYEPRRADEFYTKQVNIANILRVSAMNTVVKRKIKKLHVKKLYQLITMWVEGSSFEDLLDVCNLAEGDIIRIFRQLIDLLRQIKSGLVATNQRGPLLDSIQESIVRIDRDIVKSTL